MTEAKEVVGQGQEKAQEAAGKAEGTLREQPDQRSSQAAEKVAGTAQDLRSISEELRKQGKDTPANLADRAAERTERVGSYLRESSGDRMVEDSTRVSSQGTGGAASPRRWTSIGGRNS